MFYLPSLLHMYLELKSLHFSLDCSSCTLNFLVSCVSVRAETRHITRIWSARKILEPGYKNVKHHSLVESSRILLPPLHIKLGLMNNFVKAMDRNGTAFLYLRQKLGFNMSLKIHFLSSHLDYFPENCGSVSDEHVGFCSNGGQIQREMEPFNVSWLLLNLNAWFSKFDVRSAGESPIALEIFATFDLWRSTGKRRYLENCS
jgi:hypothetical protein